MTGTGGNDFLLFQGALQTFSTTITNPYSGEAIVLNATYNVNTAIYDGLAGIDTLLMSVMGDVLLLRDPVKNQALFNVERVFASAGTDVIHLADATFVLGDLIIDGGLDDDIIWSNAGNDIINGRAGNDIVDGGPGEDLINGGDDDDTLNGGDDGDTLNGEAGHDTLNGDAGNDVITDGPGDDVITGGDDDDIIQLVGNLPGKETVDGGDGFDEILFLNAITLADVTITPTGGTTFTIVVIASGNTVNASNVEQLRFEDGTTFALTPPPTITPTPTISPTPTITPTPTKQAKPGDTDGDGCPDVHENRPKSEASQGGGRDYKDPNDYYDVLGPGGSLTLDGVIDLPNDILGVIQHFAPLGTEPEYDVNFDRGPSAGPNPWNMTAPDGVIDLPNDILGVIQQFQHNCV